MEWSNTPCRSASRAAATLLTPAQFGALAEVLTELEWLANLSNPKNHHAQDRDRGVHRRSSKRAVSECGVSLGRRQPDSPVVDSFVRYSALQGRSKQAGLFSCQRSGEGFLRPRHHSVEIRIDDCSDGAFQKNRRWNSSGAWMNAYPKFSIDAQFLVSLGRRRI